MDETFRRALYDLGTLVKVYAGLPVLSILVALAWRETYAVPAFAATAAVAVIVGRALELAFDPPDEAGMPAGVVTVCAGWFVVGVLGALPLLLVAWTVRLDPPLLAVPSGTRTLETFLRPLDAAFEGMSGVTGTGFSMATDPSVLPRSLQWWRSSMQWIGGLGVVVLAAVFLSSEESASFSAVHGSMAPTESIRSTTRGTAAALWWLLALGTVASALLLWLAGMAPWAALNHAMTGFTTGGFTITATGIASYDDPTIELAALPVMVGGATSFALLFFLLRGDLGRVRGDAQLRWLGGGLALGTAVVVGALVLTASYPSASAALRYGAFQLVSGLTCTGFQTDVGLGDGWASPARLAVTSAMIVGGAAGSTAGGIKLIRVRRILVDAPKRGTQIYDVSDGTAETAGEASAEFDSAATIALLWFVALLTTTIVALLLLPGTDYSTANVLFEVASILGNVGLSAGIVDPTMPPALKATFLVAMWVGRLEIVPVLVSATLVLDKLGVNAP